MHRTDKIPELPLMKLMLILCVVGIHSNVNAYLSGLPGANPAGMDIVKYLVTLVSIAGVPGFFLISGFLFFRGLSEGGFTRAVYERKLRSRVKTLFIPYLFWNVLCLLVFLAKHYLFGFPGLGILTPDGVHFGRLLLGFIYVPEAGNIPYAFAFWFIRNLMIFSLLSPIIYLIARRWWSLLLFCSLFLVEGVNMYGVNWFALGAAFALHGWEPSRLRLRTPVALSLLAALLVIAAVMLFTQGIPYTLDQLWQYICLLGILALFYNLSRRLLPASRRPLLGSLVGGTFFIYAFHEIYSTSLSRAVPALIGGSQPWQAPLAFLITFLLLTVSAWVVYLLMRRYLPKFTDIITGGRSA